MSEEQLIGKIKNDPDLFGAVYDKHYQTIFNYCYRRTKDFNSSKDITSETFLKAYLNIHRFKWKGTPILSWLYRIATNEVSLYYRAKKYRPALLSEVGASSTLPANVLQSLLVEKETAEKELERHEQFLKVQKALAEIPIKYQQVISLKYFEKLKIREISEVLKISEGTIKSQLSRGIALLKHKM